MDDQVKQKLQQFFSRYPLRHIKKGTFIVHAGSNPQGIYFLTQGIVRQSVTTAKGEDVVLNLFKPVSFFPLQSAVAKISNRYDFIAFTDITIQIAPAHDLASYLQSEPERFGL
jgi:CRP-like cAMP-binding protein